MRLLERVMMRTHDVHHEKMRMSVTDESFLPADYVYFETSSSAPYQIRRIEELIKTPNGNVEVKVMCFYRRRDISSSLTALADKHYSK